MTLTQVSTDPDGLTMTVASEFGAGIERVWQVWADPRQLERWWGPPSYPATLTEHDLVPGGRVSYYMTGPEGDTHGGWWRIVAVEPPYRLEFTDGFTDDGGEPDEAMPTTVTRVTLEPSEGGGTRMTMMSVFPSLQAMEQLIEMGMEEGISAAVGQIDALLAD